MNQGNNDSVSIDMVDAAVGTGSMMDTVHTPNQRVSRIKKYQKRVHALKVGVGVLLALLFVLIHPLDKFLQHTGVWAVITVVLVILPTPGETTKKMVNRTVGTLCAALLAILVGHVGHEISLDVYPVGHILVAFLNFAVAVVGTSMADSGGTWAYAFLLGTMTFAFLSSSILVEDDVWVGVYRAAMIAMGGCIGLVVAWLPPTISGRKIAKACLTDTLSDTTLAGQILVDNFLQGRTCQPIHLISEEVAEDDLFHQLSRAVQESRAQMDAALEASLFEGSCKTDVASMRQAGLVIRLLHRSLLAADILLRQDYVPLNMQVPEDKDLGHSLQTVVASIRSNVMAKQAKARRRTSDASSGGAPAENHSANDVSVAQALAKLEMSLQSYVKRHAANVSDNDDEKKAMMQQLACHVGFTRNIYDAGTHFWRVLPYLDIMNYGLLGDDDSPPKTTTDKQ